MWWQESIDDEKEKKKADWLAGGLAGIRAKHVTLRIKASWLSIVWNERSYSESVPELPASQPVVKPGNCSLHQLIGDASDAYVVLFASSLAHKCKKHDDDDDTDDDEYVLLFL